MSSETPQFYDYKQNPHIGDFKKFVREGEARKHPWITSQEAVIAKIEGQAATLEVPCYFTQEDLPQPYEQGLELTPYDNLEAVQVVNLPEELLEGARILREYNLGLANHPARIYAMAELEGTGFQTPPSLENVIGDAEAEGTILQLSDLGHALDITRGMIHGSELDEIASKIARLRGKTDDEILSDHELKRIDEELREYMEAVKALPQAHRTELLATGPFTFVMNDHAASYIGTGANPDIQGSVPFVVTAAKMHALAEIPEIGKFSTSDVQAAFAQAVMAQIRRDDPILAGRSQEEADFIYNHWVRNVCGVVEGSSVDKAKRRASALYKAGVRTFRAYGHTSGGTIVEVVEGLVDLFEGERDVRIIASQITSAQTALAVEQAGARAIIIGVGSGGRCTTAALSQLLPTNAHMANQLRGRLGIPIIAEGGGVDNPIVSALAGISSVNGAGIFGGTVETPGRARYLTRDGKRFFKPYRGEASKAAKYLSTRYGASRTFPTGVAYMPEGGEGEKYIHPLEESMTQSMVDAWSRVVIGSVVMGYDAGPHTIKAMQQITPSPLAKKSMYGSLVQELH